MAEAMRRFGWLIVATACEVHPPDCHTADGQAPLVDYTWQTTVKSVCADNQFSISRPDVYACKDGSGREIHLRGLGVGEVWGWFSANGQLIGSKFNGGGDGDGTGCVEHTYGTQLACDLTPIDLACPVTN